jgi:hypothetical protein
MGNLSGNLVASSVYHPRDPHQSPLWQLLNDHYQDFELHYDDHCVRFYGYHRPVVRDVVEAYHQCGDLCEGFTRIRCPDCRYEYLLAFSCRGRWFCPSCHAKKGVQFGEQLREAVLYPFPHRQYVFSIPKILRLHFKYERSLLTDQPGRAPREIDRRSETETQPFDDGWPGYDEPSITLY